MNSVTLLGARRRWFALAMPLLFVASVACGVVGRAGEGPVTSVHRDVATFTRVQASNGIGVTIEIGPNTSVDVSAQGNLQPLIATEVENGTLTVRTTEAISTSASIGVTIAMPDIDGISLSGGSPGVVTGVAGDRFDVTLDGGATLTASGQANRIILNCAGGAAAELGELLAASVAVNADGGASATVNASDEVSGRASGGASVVVRGDAILNVESSGGASVSRG